MPRLHSNRDRPFHQGVLPTERLPRAAVEPAPGARQPADAHAAADDSVQASLPEYAALFQQHLNGPVAPARAPLSPARSPNGWYSDAACPRA